MAATNRSWSCASRGRETMYLQTAAYRQQHAGDAGSGAMAIVAALPVAVAPGVWGQ